MEKLKYTVIKSKSQYNKYCKALEGLLSADVISKEENEEAELLKVLIKKWDDEHNTFEDATPVEILRSLMEEHQLEPKDLMSILNIKSKGLISGILNYKKGFSKKVIRRLSDYFKVSQEAFNRPYELISPANAKLKKSNAKVMNSTKELEYAHAH